MGFLENKHEFKNEIIKAANANTLLIAKHDPMQLCITFDKYRSVISHDLANNLDSFIKSNNYEIDSYENKKFPNSSQYYVIIPNVDSGFSVPASGVTANSVFATSTLVRLVVVSGTSSGLHIFGECSSIITCCKNDGNLVYKGKLE